MPFISFNRTKNVHLRFDKPFLISYTTNTTNEEKMKTKFKTGDLVTLTCPDYRDIRKGTLGIVMEPVNEYKYMMQVWIDGEVWSFAEREFVHTRNYKEKKCK